MKILELIVYKIVIFLCKIISYVFYPNKVFGKENLKLDEPFIFYANHIKVLDTIILVGSVLKRKTYFMGKDELFRKKFAIWFFTAIGGYPVKRGTADMKAIKQSIDFLQGGESVAIFPEGTRNTNEDKSLMEFHNGLGIIALKSMKKMIPCYIDSPHGYKLFKRFNIYVGKPIDLEEFKLDGLKKENLSRLMKLSKEKMEELIPKS